MVFASEGGAICVSSAAGLKVQAEKRLWGEEGGESGKGRQDGGKACSGEASGQEADVERRT